MKRWLGLFAGTLIVGLLLVGLGRATRRTGSRTASPSMRDTTVTLDVRRDGTSPEAVALPAGTRVRFELVRRDGDVRRVSLAGYEDRVAIAFAARDTEVVILVADRPGDDFAWLVDGEPVGRVRVTGSHLIEGHR